MTTSRPLRLFLATVAIATGSRDALGSGPSTPGSLSALARLVPLPVPAAANATPATAAAADRAAAALAGAAGGPWQVELDPAGGRVRRAFGTGIPLLPGRANALPARVSPATPAELEAIGRGFIARHASLFDLDPAELSFDAEASRAAGTDGFIRPIQFRRVVAGVIVEHAQVQLVLNRGNLTYVNVTGFEPIAVSPAPSLDEAATWATVAREAGRAGVSLSGAEVRPTSLVLLPTQDAPGAPVVHRLVRRHTFTLPGGHETWRASVDAHGGDLVQFEDLNRYACTLDPSQVQGQVRGGVRPARADDPEAVRNLPLVLLDDGGTSKVSDLNGSYSYSGLAAASQLQGAYFHQTCSGCTNPGTTPRAVAGIDGTIDFGTGGMDEVGNGTSTPADRTAHYHLNVARQLASEWLTIPWLEANVGCVVNVNQQCNAFWDGAAVHFFRSGAACRNIAEVRDVVHHEWGHGLDGNDGQSYSDAAMGEAYGNYVAFLIDHDSCIGQSVMIAGGGSPFCTTIPDCTTTAPCDGQVNLDEKRTPGGVMTWSGVTATCPPSACAGPAGGECHCEGRVMGQTAYHLANNILSGNAYDTGTPLPPGNPAFSDVAAWLIQERNFFVGTALFQSYAPSSRQSIGTGAYDALMIVDDDDGDLANGTPDAAYIHQAFAHHEIDEPIAIPDAANCVPPGDPTIGLAVLLDPTTGKATVRVSFADQNAASYRLYRNIRRADFWQLVRPPVADDNRPSYDLDDEGVPIGATFNYAVVAVSANGCPSAGANVSNIRVALPDAAVLIGRLSDPAPGGDGDGIPEPGDVVELRLDLREAAGLIGIANAAVTLFSRDPLVTVVNGGPLAYGDVAAGATVVGPSNFAVGIDSTVPCGSMVPLVAAITADNGCFLRALRFDIPVLDCVPRLCAPPSGGSIANRLGMTKQGNDLVFSWAGSGTTPQRFVLLRTFDPLELADAPGGIGNETVVARPDTETATDVDALLVATPPAFYEVYAADSCGAPVFP